MASQTTTTTTTRVVDVEYDPQGRLLKETTCTTVVETVDPVAESDD